MGRGRTVPMSIPSRRSTPANRRSSLDRHGSRRAYGGTNYRPTGRGPVGRAVAFAPASCSYPDRVGSYGAVDFALVAQTRGICRGSPGRFAPATLLAALRAPRRSSQPFLLLWFVFFSPQVPRAAPAAAGWTSRTSPWYSSRMRRAVAEVPAHDFAFVASEQDWPPIA